MLATQFISFINHVFEIFTQKLIIEILFNKEIQMLFLLKNEFKFCKWKKCKCVDD
jgi:hypothetical protein